MQAQMPDPAAQVQAATSALSRVLGENLRALYLHGSMASGGLRPQSDIDLLAVVEASLTDAQREDLLAALLTLSGRHPVTPGGPRCLELMVFSLPDLSDPGFPARADFLYGEWLRDAFEQGERPRPSRDPEFTLVLAQARHAAVALLGPGAPRVLPEIPFEQVRHAMRAALPALLDGLQGDERNVLLTLARMWRTARAGGFTTKDAAAAWAIPQLSPRHAATLDHARKAYLGETADAWICHCDDARALAEHLAERVIDRP